MHKRGSTSIELLIGLLVSGILIPLIYLSLRMLVAHDYFNQEAQDEIALYQLRKIMMLTDDVRVSNGVLIAERAGEQIEVITQNNHCYLTPGTQIFFADVDEGYFESQSGLITYSFLREGVWNKRVIINE